jgi:threonine aldolase
MHRARKLQGGGMRQAGVQAAAGLYALEHHVERLAEDHANARRLAEGLQRIGLRVDPPPETNMVMFDVEDGRAFSKGLAERSLRIDPLSPGRYRAVTHLDVSQADIDEALGRIEEIVGTGAR